MIFNVAVISDIHFGAIKADQLYMELKTQFLDFIKTHYIDMIVIAGDFYNSILSLNSQSSIASFTFMSELVEICEEYNIRYIRIIEGTLSHDNFQILNFRNYCNRDEIDFKVITKVMDEELENGIRILYIPEEYVENTYEYYRDFLNVPKKYYDFIFGHGMFKEVSMVNITNEGERNIGKAPIWDSKLMVSICQGPIFFGHIHISQIIRKHIYYTGSFSRWVYGEENEKGFYIFSYDTKTCKYMVDFIENKCAKKYDTLTFNVEEGLKSGISPESVIKTARNLKVDNLRISLIIDGSDPDVNINFFITALKEHYANKSNYKIHIIDKREKLRQEVIEAKVNDLRTAYDFLFARDVPIETKIHKFIKRKYQKDISEEKVREYLDLNIENK